MTTGALEEQLASVDWTRVMHAFGPAADLPALIRRRGSPDESVAQTAGYELWNTVWHQGTVYQATAAAAKPLATLAIESSTVDRLDLLLLLAAMATGRSYREVHGGGTSRELTQERTWVRDARRAVADAAAPLFEMSADGSLQTGLAVLAAAVPEAGVAHIRSLARDFDASPSGPARQVLAVALVALGLRDDAYVDECALVEADDTLGEYVDPQDLQLLGRLRRGEATDHDAIVRVLMDLAGRAAVQSTSPRSADS